MNPCLRNIPKFLKHEKTNEIEMVAPTGFEPVFRGRHALTHVLQCRPERMATCSTADDARSHRRRARDRQLDSSAGELLRADADEAELAGTGILAVVEEGQE